MNIETLQNELMNNLSLNEKYLVDKEGHRIGVILTMQEFR